MIKLMVLISSVVFFFQFSLYVHGAEPMDTLKNSTDYVLAILKDPVYKDSTKKGLQREKIQAKIRDMFDFGEMAKRTVGVHWKKFTPKEQIEFTDVFTQYLETLYISRIQGYTNLKVMYLGENVSAEFKAAVNTKIVTENLQIPIDYRMIMKNEGWKVYDVNIAGVSLVRNYRAQFQNILMKESPDALIEKLKQKVRAGEEKEFAQANQYLRMYFSRLGPLLRSGSCKMFPLTTAQNR
jgi:phospholipid transport system substrate-binding protein